jgi:hypothetical protein
MSRKASDLPERLRAGGGTDLERRLLNAMAHEQTPPDVRERVARGLGVSTTGLGVAGSGTATSTGSTASKAAAGAGTGSVPLLPWISAGLLGLVVVGGIVGTRAWKTSHRQPPALPAVVVSPTAAIGAAAVPAPAEPALLETVPVVVVEPRPSAAAARPSRQLRAGTPTTDLRDQTALVDAARAAVSSGAANRALEIARQYEEKYPAGAIRPEAAAIKIDALAKLGRGAEARALAQRFMTEYGPGPLSDRVARIAGLTQP